MRRKKKVKKIATIAENNCCWGNSY